MAPGGSAAASTGASVPEDKRTRAGSGNGIRVRLTAIAYFGKTCLDIDNCHSH